MSLQEAKKEYLEFGKECNDYHDGVVHPVHNYIKELERESRCLTGFIMEQERTIQRLKLRGSNG